MAKQETKDKEQESFQTLDNAFQGTDEQESTEAAETATTETLKAEEEAATTTETEVVETADADTAKVKETAEESEAETKEQLWSELGLERYDGMTKEQIAKDILWLRRISNRQAQEVGKLRKLKVEHSAVEKAEKEVAEKVDPLDLISDLTPTQLADFNELYEQNPTRAILKYGGDYIKTMVADGIKNVLGTDVKKVVEESLSQKEEDLAYKLFKQNHPDDAEEQLPMMEVLDSPEHLGGQHRDYEELFQLSKLAANKDPIYGAVYGIIKKHPTVSLDEAKIFAKQQSTSKTNAAARRQTIKQEVGAIDTVNTATTKNKVAAKVKQFNTIDQAFESSSEDE